MLPERQVPRGTDARADADRMVAVPARTRCPPGPDLFGETLETERVANPNLAAVTKLSPFRYPGGKTWLVPDVVSWLRALPAPPSLFVEPFAGGASVSLNVAAAGLAGATLMVELDPDVAAVWTVTLGPSEADFEDLCGRIRRLEMGRETVVDLLARADGGLPGQAFRTILRNRVNRGGIMAPNAGMAREGEQGRGLASRWYPTTLLRRLRSVRALSGRLAFRQGDAFDALAEHAGDARAAFFVDPPYTAGGERVGERLYRHCGVDHPGLFAAVARLRGRAMLTYDAVPEAESLARDHGFSVGRVRMRGGQRSVKEELVILKDVV